MVKCGLKELSIFGDGIFVKPSKGCTVLPHMQTQVGTLLHAVFRNTSMSSTFKVPMFVTYVIQQIILY